MTGTDVARISGRERLRAKIETALSGLWYGTARPPLWARLGERLFLRIAAARRRQFMSGARKSLRMPVPVIVVGNLTIGGTGKTPLVLWLCEWLKTRGLRPGILSGGYRGNSSQWPRRVGPESDPETVGDEAVLLARRSGVPVMADPLRTRSAAELLKSGVDVIVCDDGLQHYQIERDVEFVVIDGARGFGNGHCLPAGPLREPVERLTEADFVIVNGETGLDLRECLTMRVAPVELRNLADPRRTRPLNEVKGWRAHAVAGIGNPQRFFDTLTDLGINFVPHALPDHVEIEPAWLEFGDDLAVIMTEKDAVKCESWAAPNFWFVRVAATFEPHVVEGLTTRLAALLRI